MAQHARHAPESDSPLADHGWLVADEGRAWLDRLSGDTAWSALSLVARLGKLRRDMSANRAHLLEQQLELRRRGRAKFALADRMFFTPLGLEQATDEVTAGYKAARFASDSRVVDLCCGLGGDFLSLAARGAATAIDRDELAVLLCQANLTAHAAARLDRSTAHVARSAVSADALAGATAWHIDPDRRPRGNRTTQVELHEPDAAAIDGLLKVNANAAIKLAPAAELNEDWRSAAEQEWISRDGQCRQLVAWFGDLARRHGRRAATVLRDANDPPRTVIEEPNRDFIPRAASVGRYVHEPDAAILAAKLTATLAAEHALAEIEPNVAYLTGDQPVADAALATFEVLDCLPYDTRRVRQWLRDRDIGQVEVKKRVVELDPERVRRELRTSCEGRATLLLFPRQGHVMAILARRCARP